jgi:phenylacetic acid degradation operon negative regulatory protein
MLKNGLTKKILLFLAAGFDYWDSHLSYSAVRYRNYFGHHRRSSIYSSVSRLLKIGEVEKVVKNGQCYLRLTSLGYNRIKQDVPLLFNTDKPWDGFWRLVVFDIEEKHRRDRNALRHKLTSLGFGLWQKSVFISPLSVEKEINDWLQSTGLYGRVFCLKAKKLGISDDREIARRVFKLDKLAQNYQFLNTKIQAALGKAKSGSLMKSVVSEIMDEYFWMLQTDPGLPPELMPLEWSGNDTKRDIRRLIKTV